MEENEFEEFGKKIWEAEINAEMMPLKDRPIGSAYAENPLGSIPLDSQRTMAGLCP